MSRRLLGIGISASLLIVLLVARVGGEATGRGAGASPTAPIGPSSPVPSSVGSLVTGAIGSIVGPSVLSMKTGGRVLVVTSASSCESALAPSTTLVRWCSMVLSPEPVTMPAANLTVDDEPTFWAITSRGLLMRDDTVCDLAGVEWWLRIRARTQDPAAWCRDSFATLRAQGWFAVTDGGANISVRINLPAL
jgi:hypothetical protein